MPKLDGLRLIAVSAVAFGHWVDMPEYKWLGPLNKFLAMSGVNLFFVLSGFLITQILLSNKNEKGVLGQFYISRIVVPFLWKSNQQFEKIFSLQNRSRNWNQAGEAFFIYSCVQRQVKLLLSRGIFLQTVTQQEICKCMSQALRQLNSGMVFVKKCVQTRINGEKTTTTYCLATHRSAECGTQKISQGARLQFLPEYAGRNYGYHQNNWKGACAKRKQIETRQ